GTPAAGEEPHVIRRSALPLTLLALLFALLIVPTAAADVLPGTTTVVKPSLRVEAVSHTVAPATTVAVPLTSTVVDSLGTGASFAEPMAMVAFAKAADRRGFTFEGLEFLDRVANLGDPVSWTSWWLYQVNGWQPDFGMAALPVITGDKVVVFQCASEAPWTNKQLDVRASPRGVRPGEPITLTVREDDLSKFNGMAAFDRWGPDPTGMTDEEIASYIESIWASPLSAGAVLHVGSRVYELTAPDFENGTITLTDLPVGRYSVWAEKPFDAEYNYVRSAETLIDVGPGAKISNVRVAPNPYVPKTVMRVTFLLSTKASVGMKIYNTYGQRVATVKAKTLYAGTRTLKWDGVRSAPLTTKLTVRLRAVDTWGRVTLKSVTVSVAR
ncbi:MAG: DUF4430 domain-containing protein, partial [Thermoleophilia bacterium]|nr:DUF4430 domain-containing protein [Thermoleophilia bacterium]